MRSSYTEKSSHVSQTHYRSYAQPKKRYVWLCIGCFFFCLCSSFITVTAQPSGGPYGPIRQTYKLPTGTGKIYYVATDGQAEQTGESLTRPTTLEAAIEQIDIGGVALLRAAAKNYAQVTVVCDPGDYAPTLVEIEAEGEVSPETRLRLAIRAFDRTSAYDAAIGRYLSADGPLLPDTLTLGLRKLTNLRYGENPHQQAALYGLPGVSGPLGGELVQGKPL